MSEIPPDLLVAERCTKCSRRYCTADFIHDSTKNKRKIRRDSDALTNNRSSCDVQNDWTEMPRVVNQNVDQRQSISRRAIRLHHTQINLGRPQILRYRTLTASASWRSYTATRKNQYWQTKKVTCSEIKKEPNRVILCQACSSTWFYRRHWKTTFRAGKRKKGPHKPEICRRRAPVCILRGTASTKMCDLKKSTEKVGLRNTSRKDENS